MNKLILLLFCGISSAVANFISPPNCIVNYTAHMDQIINENQVNNINTYSSIDAKECGKHCLNNTNCSSFNYYPNIVDKNLISRCTLISSKFNSSYLDTKLDSACYVKGHNKCNSTHRESYVYIIMLLILISLCICGCVCCIGKKHNRTSYDSIGR